MIKKIVLYLTISMLVSFVLACPPFADQDIDGDGYSVIAGDCDDNNADINPGAEDLCGDGIDQDCIGGDLACDDLNVDFDGDNFTPNQGDCDDNDPDTNPAALDLCGDGIDQDCTGSDLTCEDDNNDIDDDGDGNTENNGDCNDDNDSIHPYAVEICEDGIDQNCDSVDAACSSPLDMDGDGYTSEEGDCNDNDDTINPSEVDICGDGLDQDCSGGDLICEIDPNDVDDDGDGYTENAGDCNDTDGNINPGANDNFGDGIDMNCSGGDGNMTSISGNPGFRKRCVKSAMNSGYQFSDCPDGGSAVLYSFLTEDYSNENRNPGAGGWYVAYNGSATNGDPSYQVNVTHNWHPFEHVQAPLNYFWWTGSPGRWKAHILTAQYHDRLIYSNQPDFDPALQYVANGIEEYTPFGLQNPGNLSSVLLQGRVRLERTLNPDCRVVAKFDWTRHGEDKSYILELNLWSSNQKQGWRTGVALDAWSNHHGQHAGYITMGIQGHGMPLLSAAEGGTFYNIDWGSIVTWLQNTSCIAVGGPNPCLPAGSETNIKSLKVGFMTERSNMGEIQISIEQMDVLKN